MAQPNEQKVKRAEVNPGNLLKLDPYTSHRNPLLVQLIPLPAKKDIFVFTSTVFLQNINNILTQNVLHIFVW